MTNTYAVLLRLCLALPPDKRTFIAGQFLADWYAEGDSRPNERAPCGCLLGTLSPRDEFTDLNMGAEERYARVVDFREWADIHGLSKNEMRAAERVNDRYYPDYGVEIDVDYELCEDRYAHVVGSLAGMAFRLAESGNSDEVRQEIYDWAMAHGYYEHEEDEEEEEETA